MKSIQKFKERLAELMFFAGEMTSGQLGKASGIGTSTVSCWLVGRSYPLLSSAVKVADYFNCSLEFLFGGTDKPLDFTMHKTEAFYEQILKVMKERGVTRYRIVKEKKIPQTNFIDWSRGSDPYMQSVIDLSDYLEVTLDYLVGREK